MTGRPRLVFVSHTSELRLYPDSRSFVDAASDAIISARDVLIDMKYFTARAEQPASYCREEVMKADLYVGIIGFKYGSPVPDQPHLSYTELEYLAAKEDRKPILIFLIGNKTINVPADFYIDHEYGARQEKFRQTLMKSGVIASTITTPDQLSQKLYQSLIEEAKESLPVQILQSVSRTLTNSSTTTVRHNLPNPDYFEFVGREKETALISRALDPENPVSVVKLIGFNGSGRSAMALEIAKRCCKAAHQDPADSLAFRGVVWASGQSTVMTPRGEHRRPRADLYTLDEFFQTIARTLDAAELNRLSPEERNAQIRQLLSSNRYLLIVDDIDEIPDPLIRGFFNTLPLGTKAIVTMSPKGASLVEGLHIPVMGLDLNSAIQLMKVDARVRNTRAIEDTDPTELERFCSEIDCLPLALRIAVAQLAEQDETFSWVTHWFGEHEDSRPDTLSNPAELAAYCLDKTAQGLNAAERRVLYAFSTYPQPTDIAAAGWVARVEGQQLSNSLTRLLRLGLLHKLERNPEADITLLSNEPTLYYVNRLTRVFCQKELSKEGWPTDYWTLPAIAYMHDFVSKLTHIVFDDDPKLADNSTFRLIDEQILNLLWAARKAYDLKKWEKLFHFRRTFGDFLYFGGYYDKAVELGNLALEAANAQHEIEEAGWCLLYPLARICLRRREIPQAREYGERSLGFFQRLGTADGAYGAVHAKRLIARTLEKAGDLDGARRLFIEAFKDLRRLSPKPKVQRTRAHLLISLATIAERGERYGKASHFLRLALRRYRAEGVNDLAGTATALQHLGTIALAREDFDTSEIYLQESLKALGSWAGARRQAEIASKLAVIEEKRGDLPAAAEQLIIARDAYQMVSAAHAARLEAELMRVAEQFGRRRCWTEMPAAATISESFHPAILFTTS